MNSLEALKEYKSIKDYYFHKATSNRLTTLRIFNEEENIYQTIEKDLKVLEIIKQNVFLDEGGNIMPKNRDKSQSEIDLLKGCLK